MPTRDRPTLTVRPNWEFGGILWVPAVELNWEWYYHHGEGRVFPRDCAHRLHTGHAVTPVKPSTVKPS